MLIVVLDNIPTGTDGFGRYPTSGNQFFNDVSSELDIFFDQDVAAFGFNGIDVGDFDGQIIVDVRNEGVLIESITIDSTIGVLEEVYFSLVLLPKARIRFWMN